MKRLAFFITILFVLSSCTHTIFDIGIVKEVKIEDNSKFKYMITVDISCYSDVTVQVLTNTLYNVGDTIKFYKVGK